MFDIAFIEKPGNAGLTRSEVIDLYDSVSGEVYPLEIYAKDGQNSTAMGFIAASAAEKLDYLTDPDSELADFIGEILSDMGKETEDGVYEFKGLKIWLNRNDRESLQPVETWVKTDDLQYCRKIDEMHYELIEASECSDGTCLISEPAVIDLNDYLDADGNFKREAEEVIRYYHKDTAEFNDACNGSVVSMKQLLAEMVYESIESVPISECVAPDGETASLILEYYTKYGEILDTDEIFEYGGKHFIPKGRLDTEKDETGGAV